MSRPVIWRVRVRRSAEVWVSVMSSDPVSAEAEADLTERTVEHARQLRRVADFLLKFGRVESELCDQFFSEHSVCARAQ